MKSIIFGLFPKRLFRKGCFLFFIVFFYFSYIRYDFLILIKDYAITIYLLLELTNLVFQSGSIEFEANEWKTVISSDCLQQNDGHNCGIFVILNLAAMFIGN